MFRLPIGKEKIYLKPHFVTGGVKEWSEDEDYTLSGELFMGQNISN